MRILALLAELGRVVEVVIEGPVMPGLSRFQHEGDEWVILGQQEGVWLARRCCNTACC